MTNTALTEVARNRSFDGWQLRYQHSSAILQCEMTFSVYLPPQAESGKVPHIYWLSGLTCDDQNFVTKAGAQKYAADYGIAIITPDTSPRGEHIPDKEDWDFGSGAGFYLNASETPWSDNYRMYDYLLTELMPLIEENFPVDSAKRSIFGHSMGGHGALTIALKNPERFKSVSAFAPICAPTQCPWGQKAFQLYLGNDTSQWQQYDSCALIKQKGLPWPVLVDQGDQDPFLDQLLPDKLKEVCLHQAHPLILNTRKGYDHSYFFIASFIDKHIAHHAKYLGDL